LRLGGASNLPLETLSSQFIEDAKKCTTFHAGYVPDSQLFRAMGQVLSYLVVLNHINRLGTNVNYNLLNWNTFFEIYKRLNL